MPMIILLRIIIGYKFGENNTGIMGCLQAKHNQRVIENYNS